MIKFTDKFIKNLEPKKSRYDIWEGDGFGIRVFPTGKKSFVYRYKFNGRDRRMTLGIYDPKTLTLKEARLLYIDALRDRKRGLDPAAERVAAKEAQQRREQADKLEKTVSDLVDIYVEKWAKLNKSSWAEDRRMLTKDVIPSLGKQKIAQVTRVQVVSLLDEVAKRGNVSANRMLAVIRRMFNFAIERGLIENSPVERIKSPGGKEESRERILTVDEMAQLWDSLEREGTNRKHRLAIQYLLVTGQRRGEVLKSKWQDIDWENSIWTIHSKNTKNNKLQRVALSSLALEILKELRGMASEEGVYIFESSVSGSPIHGTTISHTVQNIRLSAQELAVLDRFTVYDLRRTVASGLAELGFSRSIQNLVLNHKDSSTTFATGGVREV